MGEYVRTTTTLRACLICWVLGGATPAVAAEEPSHDVTVAAYYSQGDYGENADTTIHYVPISYEYRQSGWRFGFTAPYLRIAGPGNVLVNAGGVRRPGQEPSWPVDQRVSADGAGDVLLNLTRELEPLWRDGPFVDLGLELKLPTADARKGLGTGEVDVAAQIDLYQMLGEATVFATLGRRFRAKSEWFHGLRDSNYLSLGFSRPWPGQGRSGQWRYGTIYDYREAVSALSVETHELLPYLSWSPTPRWTLMGYTAAGFTRDSPDFAVGLQLNYQW